MQSSPMTLPRFLELVAAYGSRFSRWPETERGAAEALLASSDAARAALAEEAELDDALDTIAAPELSPRLLRRLNEIPIRTPATRRTPWPLRRLWQPALGWAAAAVVGVVLGQRLSESDDGLSGPGQAVEAAAAESSPSDEALASLALGSLYDEFEELP